ncbi:MAG: transcription-repair-coupling factor [Phycisphaerae bacterium]|nr:MAG: transcription-repair coupling factor [Planctomycetia bacterium]GJQ26523.1 MAG: transcription-repair-coupling factor [Phycisphaerae bacterium]
MLPWHDIAVDARVAALAARLKAGGPPLAAHGLWGSCAPILAGLLSRQLHRPLLFVTAHLDQADEARDDLETIFVQRADRASDRPDPVEPPVVELLPAWETLPGEGAGSGEINTERTRLCEALRRGERPIIVAPIQALMQPVPAASALDANTMTLSVGEERTPESIADYLVARGFTRLDQVEQPGDFALRGGILDIFATIDADPLRIEFFGDEIESIRPFEVGTQRSTRTLPSARITLPPPPGRTPGETTTFTHYLPPDTIIVLHESLEIAEIGRTVLERLGNPVGHYTIEALLRQFATFAVLHVSRFASESASAADTFELTCEGLPTFEGKSTDAVLQLLQLAKQQRVYVYCDNDGERERLNELIAQSIVPQEPAAQAVEIRNPIAQAIEPTGNAAANIVLQLGTIHRGFRWIASDATSPRAFAVVPHHELFRRYTLKRSIRKIAAGRPIESFLDLEEGDYVVHVVHGIGRFTGMRTAAKGGSGKSEEYLTLRFADDGVVHVPASQIDLVQKYIGAKGARPTLSKLGGTRWQKTKARVEEAVSDLAADLLRVAASRDAEGGVAYPADTRWQKEFEASFPYTETPDQLTALADIKRDMAMPRAMDRLLCGDVGYGKTELAMRAAFKAVEFGKQVAVLVPTTVLAEQHFRTFSERFAEYPFTVRCLNRYRTSAEQKEMVAAVRKGQVDVLIGTHRILSRDVRFADLGLVIVDEEQRFGVEQKERLKHLRATVEVLTLSATPIPRTLHMSMIGLRDISSLATPPMDRRSISTRVVSWSDDLIRESIIRELNRDGQVFFVHNRVKSIHTVAAKLMTLVPEARFLVGHGQMPSDELEEVMTRFINREADVLVSTSIIEAGLDIPSANTIFIDRAELFGLADLHQLRGRVGRYKHRAYCYLMLSPNRPLTSTAAKRLKAVEEYSELGAGFRIAMRDLEIRGAGNLLGPEQSGHIAAVGYEMYCQLLEQAVKRLRGEAPSQRVAVHVELDVEAYIPRGYIPSDRQRMECYRRVAACRTADDVDLLARDLIDAFGRYPKSVETLLTLTEIKVRAAGWSIKTIIKKEPDIVFTFDGEVRKIEPLFTNRGGSVRIPDGRTIHWRVPDVYFSADSLLAILKNLFRGERTGLESPPAVAGVSPRAAAAASAASHAAPEPARSATRTPSGPVPVTPNQLPADAPRKRRRRERNA